MICVVANGTQKWREKDETQQQHQKIIQQREGERAEKKVCKEFDERLKLEKKEKYKIFRHSIARTCVYVWNMLRIQTCMLSSNNKK